MPLALDGQPISMAVGMRRLISSWGGPLLRLTGPSVSLETDVGVYPGTDELHRGEMVQHGALEGSSSSKRWYDQSGHAHDIPFVIAGNAGFQQKNPLFGAIGQRSAEAGATGDTAGSPTSNNLVTAAEGTLLFCGAGIYPFGGSAAPPYATANFVSDNNSGYGINARYPFDTGVQHTSKELEICGYVWTDTLEDWVVLPIPFERYKTAACALRWKDQHVMFFLNGVWAGPTFFGPGIFWQGDPTGAFVVGSSGFYGSLHGEIVTSQTALPDNVIQAWCNEALTYWGSPPTSGGSGARRSSVMTGGTAV